MCTHLRAIVSTYNRLELNFDSVTKSNFHLIFRLVHPENVLSLTLSDDYKTPGQIRLFLSLLSIDRFTRLVSLTLLGIDDHHLSMLLLAGLPPTLTSLIITWREAHRPTPVTLEFLSSVIDRFHLGKLQLNTGSYAIEDLHWPIQHTLEHVTLMYITHKQYCILLRQIPHLKTLILSHCSLHEVDDSVQTMPSAADPQLRSLALTDSRLSMDGLVSLLVLTPLLVDLKIICSPDSFDTVADGCRWEEFIRTHLALLNKFEFFFTNTYNVYYNTREVDLLISRFRTPFWLEEKHWHVTCDYINYLNQVMLYSVPICNAEFTYECQATKISCSNFVTSMHSLGNDIDASNVRTMNVTLTKLRAGVSAAKVQC